MVFDEFTILERLVSQMSPITVDSSDYTVQFGFGTHTDLLAWLNQKRKEGSGIYPLIWVETPVTLKGNPFAEGDYNIIIATLTTKDLSNKERLTVTFEDVLFPTWDSFYYQLNRESIIGFIEEMDVSYTKHFNYDTNDETEGSDVWDALRIEITLIFNLNCI